MLGTVGDDIARSIHEGHEILLRCNIHLNSKAINLRKWTHLVVQDGAFDLGLPAAVTSKVSERMDSIATWNQKDLLT